MIRHAKKLPSSCVKLKLPIQILARSIFFLKSRSRFSVCRGRRCRSATTHKLDRVIPNSRQQPGVEPRTTAPDFELKQSCRKSLPVCTGPTFTEFSVQKFAVVYQYVGMEPARCVCVCLFLYMWIRASRSGKLQTRRGGRLCVKMRRCIDVWHHYYHCCDPLRGNKEKYIWRSGAKKKRKSEGRR